MTLHPHSIGPVPEETARIAHAACPKGNPYLQMRDLLGTLYDDQVFAALFPPQGQPALAPWRLALVSIMQFAEGLSDRQAAEAVRMRIDWKYALNLELNHPGFDFSVLCEFRARLLAGHAEQLLFETMLDQFKTHGLLKARGHQRTDSTHDLAAIRTLNRLECVGETMRHALEALAVVAPAWLLRALSTQHGRSVMSSASRSIDCLKVVLIVRHSPRRLAPMASLCWLPWQIRQLQSGCERFLL